MKRAPNSGSVYKLSGRRRKPWIARITIRTELDEEHQTTHQIRQTIGTFATKAEAQAALESYNVRPYDISAKSIMFSEVYSKWSNDHFQNIVPSAVRTWESAYRHCKPIHNRPFAELRPAELEDVIRTADVGEPTKQRMKSLLNLMYKFALKNDIVQKDYARLVEVHSCPRKSVMHKSFTEGQIAVLWANKTLPWVNMILVGIYMGWRPQELATLPLSAVDTETWTITAGSKTEAGKNRQIPVHSCLHEEILTQYEKAVQSGSSTLFFDAESQSGKSMTYDKYRKRFDKVMKRFDWDNRPHDTRHTFITLGKRYGMDEHVLKILVGHATGDLTEDVYTHRNIDDFRREIEKIKAPGI